MSFPCDKTGCQAEAVGLLALSVPAKGGSTQPGEVIRCITQLKLCARHLSEANAQEFLAADPRWKGSILQICQQRRLAEPDFSRAFVSGEDFDHGSW